MKTSPCPQGCKLLLVAFLDGWAEGHYRLPGYDATFLLLFSFLISSMASFLTFSMTLRFTSQKEIISSPWLIRHDITVLGYTVHYLVILRLKNYMILTELLIIAYCTMFMCVFLCKASLLNFNCCLVFIRLLLCHSFWILDQKNHFNNSQSIKGKVKVLLGYITN